MLLELTVMCRKQQMGGVDAEVRQLTEAGRREWASKLDQVVARLEVEARELDKFDEATRRNKEIIENDFDTNKGKVVQILLDSVMRVELTVPETVKSVLKKQEEQGSDSD